ncbi:hypothetical protein AFR_41410 [Actinoplanes friuliensis DSM 7358]|uniref:Uncharacterized protein n=1 Tax=Actinoplanes friuliensis DSM 7358 TaxID=1246995 RepID=U5WF29_9ACTN|nr:hypothetical protein AFR_41410 [Actinoplanes friuliensis DSM 7358]
MGRGGSTEYGGGTYGGAEYGGGYDPGSAWADQSGAAPQYAAAQPADYTRGEDYLSDEHTGGDNYALSGQHTGSGNYGATGRDNYAAGGEHTGGDNFAAGGERTGGDNFAAGGERTGSSDYATSGSYSTGGNYGTGGSYATDGNYAAGSSYAGGADYATSSDYAISQDYTGAGNANGAGVGTSYGSGTGYDSAPVVEYQAGSNDAAPQRASRRHAAPDTGTDIGRYGLADQAQDGGYEATGYGYGVPLTEDRTGAYHSGGTSGYIDNGSYVTFGPQSEQGRPETGGYYGTDQRDEHGRW